MSAKNPQAYLMDVSHVSEIKENKQDNKTDKDVS